MNVNTDALIHCRHLLAWLFVAFVSDMLMLWIAYHRLKPGWMRVVAFVFGVCFVLALPILGMTFGCGTI
jgi:hypothetical protein